MKILKLLKIKKDKPGSLLVAAIIIISSTMVIALALGTYTLNQYQLAQRGVSTTSALIAAQTGLDQATNTINNDEYYYKHCMCLGSEVSVPSGAGGNKTTYTIQNVMPLTDSARSAFDYSVMVIGKVYKGNTSTLITQRTISAYLSATNFDGTHNEKYQYAAQGGYGSSGGSTITADGGGQITGGLVRAAGNIESGNPGGAGSSNPKVVADEGWAGLFLCANGSTFPYKCGAGTVPFHGDACNTTPNPNVCPTVTITKAHAPGGNCTGTGRVTITTYVCDATPGTNANQDIPDVGRTKIKNSVVNTLNASQGCGTFGTKPGETTKIVGNLACVSGTVTIKGDLWITGYFDASSSATVVPGDTDSYGNPILNAPIVMADGCCVDTTDGVLFISNGTVALRNTYGIPGIYASYYCAQAGCPDGPLTGAALQAEVNTARAQVDPNGGGNVATVQGVLYSRWGVAYVVGANGNVTGSAIGQSVRIIGVNSNILFDSPDDLNLGGRQGKQFKVISYSEIPTPSSIITTSTIAGSGAPTCNGSGCDNNISMAIGSDGFPVVAWYNSATHHLDVTHCGNAACNSGNTTVDNPASLANNNGDYNSIAIGTDGLPIIAYRDITALDLLVTHCGNVYCNNSNTVYQADTSGDMGSYNSITIGADGLPIIAHWYLTNGYTRTVKCGNLLCNSGNVVTNEDTSTAGHNGITVGFDGLPILSERRGSTFMGAAKCTTPDCSGTSTKTNLDTTNDGANNSIAITSLELPIIAYGTNALRTATCGTPSCTYISLGATIDSGTVNARTSIAIGADGLPVIVYGMGGNIKFARCGTASCAQGNSTTSIEAGSQGAVRIGRDGYPVFAYITSAGAVKVRKCGNLSCT